MKSKVPVIILRFGSLWLVCLRSRVFFDQEPWPVPDTYKNKVNPLKGDAESLVNR